MQTYGRHGRETSAYDTIWRVFGLTRLALTAGAFVLCWIALRFGDRAWVRPLVFFAAGFGLVSVVSLMPRLAPRQKRLVEGVSMVVGAGLCFAIVQAMGGVGGAFVFVFLVPVFTYGFRLGRRAAYLSAATSSVVIGSLIVYELARGMPLENLFAAIAVLFTLWPEAFCVEGLVRHELEWRRELVDMAERDPLTGLANRRTLQRVLERSASGGGPFALLLLDLDGFKAVNDELGHIRGDEVLKAVAHLMVQVLRRDDTVIRYGGDEFALVLDGARDEARRVFDRLRKAVSQLGMEIGIRLGFSAGIAVWPEDGGSLGELMQIADRRLYQDKHDAHEGGERRMENGPKVVPVENGACSLCD